MFQFWVFDYKKKANKCFVNCFSFQDSSDVKLALEPTNLGSLDITGDASQEIQLSDCPVSRTRSKEKQLEEVRETTVCLFFCAFLIYLNLPLYYSKYLCRSNLFFDCVGFFLALLCH